MSDQNPYEVELGYVCQAKDLDLPLQGDLLAEFKQIFTGEEAWRMSFGDNSPQEFWGRFGVNFNEPTVRAAVAIDLVKLENDSVSNDSMYTYGWHLYYSAPEYERLVLNRNFRINLVNLEDGWTDIEYDDGTVRTQRTIDRMFQGAVFSETFLQYFDSLFKNMDNPLDVYVPFTCDDDFTTEVSLIPNTHPDFNPIFSRSYYDTKYEEYKSRLQQYNISAISTFALVDDKKDKTHTGKWLVKVQRRFGENNYGYIVLTVDMDGRIQTDENGKPDIEVWPGEQNTILCVCEQDFKRDAPSQVNLRDAQQPEQPKKDYIKMVKSTTSSHYSVFRQRIPDYDLKEVRHYIQFKTRLEGMELMLEHLKRDIDLKEVHASECFAKETMAISRLFEEFKKHEKLMDLVVKYYEYVYEYDELYQKLVKLRGMRDEKIDLLDKLIQEYNDLSNPDIDGELKLRPDKNLDRKIALGEKIKSLKLEIDKSMKGAVDYLVDRLKQIVAEVDNLNQQIVDIQKIEYVDMDSKEVEDALQEMRDMFSSDEDSEFSKAKREMKEKADKIVQQDDVPHDAPWVVDDSEVDYNQRMLDIIAKHISEWRGRQSVFVRSDEDTIEKYQDIANIDTTRLHEIVLSTERWRNYMQNMGYELNQMKEMLTMCEDATIKVRRLVHNFKERMEETESQVWDENHNLKQDFDFKNISVAGLYDIILLHDWYACNAPEKTPEEMGMTEDEFEQFRIKCNTVSYNLRKNQYAQLLAVRADRTQNRILELQRIIADEDTLHWKDKYGWEAKKEQDEEDEKKEKWNAKDYLLKKGKAKAIVFTKAENALRRIQMDEKQYKLDAEMMKERTMEYLARMGIAKDESELESLAVRNASANYKGDIMRELDMVEKRKNELDYAIGRMNRQRDALKSIIDGITKAEIEISELKEANRRIFDACLVEKNRQTRNRLLLQKLDNERRIADIQSTIDETRKKNLQDFSSLERMRSDVDKRQIEYDNSVAEFKQNIGVNEDMIENLAIGIYNKFQNEILDNSKRKQK